MNRSKVGAILISVAMIVLTACKQSDIDAVSKVLGITFTPEQNSALLAIPDPQVGLHGMPFAREGLDDCAEMNFYREQAGLPERFGDGGRHQLWVRSDGIGWRESKCTNDMSVRTWCCYGYYQLYFNLQYNDRAGRAMYDYCEVSQISDYAVNTPLAKQKQSCVAKQMYQLLGMGPWS